MSEDSPALARKMINDSSIGLYEEEIDVLDGEETLNTAPLSLHARMFALADKYHVDSLQSLTASQSTP